MRSDFLITDNEVSRGEWRLPLLHPVTEEDLPEIRSRYMEWLLRKYHFYEIAPDWWLVRGKEIEQSDEVYFDLHGQVYGNNALLPDLPSFERWLAALAA